MQAFCFPKVRPAPKPDRWQQLRSEYARNGWVVLKDFVTVFGKCGKSKPKDAVERAQKRLKEKNCPLKDKDEEGQTRGRPPKMARVSDLARVFADWQWDLASWFQNKARILVSQNDLIRFISHQ